MQVCIPSENEWLYTFGLDRMNETGLKVLILDQTYVYSSAPTLGGNKKI